MKVEVKVAARDKNVWKAGDLLINKKWGNIVLFLKDHEYMDRFCGLELHSPIDSQNLYTLHIVWARGSFELFRGTITLSND